MDIESIEALRRALDEGVPLGRLRLQGLDLTDAMGDVDPQNFAAIQEMLGNPQTLLEAARTDAQRDTARRLPTAVTEAALAITSVPLLPPV